MAKKFMKKARIFHGCTYFDESFGGNGQGRLTIRDLLLMGRGTVLELNKLAVNAGSHSQ